MSCNQMHTASGNSPAAFGRLGLGNCTLSLWYLEQQYMPRRAVWRDARYARSCGARPAVPLRRAEEEIVARYDVTEDFPPPYCKH